MNANPVLPNDNPPFPAAYFRCCQVRSNKGKLEVYLNQYKVQSWVHPSNTTNDPKLWWQLSTIQNIFSKVEDTKDQKALIKAVEVLNGVLNVFFLLYFEITPTSYFHSVNCYNQCPR